MLLSSVLLGFGLTAAAWANSNSSFDQELGAVASESSVCSAIGIDILKKGGNAADALIAQQFCVGVIGINGSYEFIDFRERATAAAFETMYSSPLSNSNYSLYGGLASGNYGTLSWKHLMQPAIKLARYGFNVTADLVRYMGSATSGSYDFLTYDETWALDFAPNGTRLGLGDVMTRKRYANTLESIAEHGPDAFYKGAIANATITALQKSNGTMTLADLANYTVEIRQTSNITYRGFRIHSGSAPSSGAVVLSIMKIIEGYDMSTPSQLNFSTHYLDEGMRFAYGQRTLLGDPTFSSNLTDYQISIYDPDGYGILTDSGTSAGVASDRSGLTIAITSTVNTLFGSQLMVPETGIIMNNEMNDFSIPNTTNAFGYIPTEANFIAPFKRPVSSISPTIVEFPDGTLYHVLDQNLTSAQSLAQPRMHDQLSPNTVSFEYASPFQHVEGYSNETTAFMRSIGANVAFVAPGSTTAQALRRLGNGTFEAAGDPRQLNSAGYAV
ncbi:gamma-glutamyltranspeptidase [Hyaloscypha variabilis]